MRCANCGKEVEGAPRKAWMWAGTVVMIMSLVGGIGYWGWTNKLATDEAMRRLADEVQHRTAAEEDMRRAAAEAEKRRAVAEEAKRRASEAEALERAELAAAQAALDKHIAEEERLAKARMGAK